MTRTIAIPDAGIFADALDCLDAGLFLIDRSGCIVHANASARAMLDRRSVLRVTDGKLVACETSTAQALQAILAGSRLHSGWIALPLPAPDGEHCVAHVLPPACASRGHAGKRAIAALLVHKVAIELPSLPEAIAALYGLTPREVRVLLAIVEVGGVPETAEALGIGEATVKTHLHRLFGKTGATRQADLVKLVAGFASPFVRTRSGPFRASHTHRSEQYAEGGSG